MTDTPKQKIRPLDQTVRIMSSDHIFHDVFRFNRFTEDIEYVSTPEWDLSVPPGKIIDDSDLTNIRYYMSRIHSIEPSKAIVGEASFIVSSRNSYHPVKQYIESEKWDGIPRIDEWLIKSTGCIDNKYTREVSAKFLIATVNRVYNPGCKFDHMMILEGAQGMGKSTLVETLADKFYLDTSFENKDKDLIDSMRTAMIVEISELSGMSKKDVDWMKSFITRKVDRVRLAYAMLTKDFKRKSVLVGTFNPSGNNTYLRDDTGNRRFWPIECKKIDVQYVKENRRQLWAEALTRKSEQYYISDPESLRLLTEMHADREIEGPTFYKIRDWLNTVQVNYVTMNSIIEDALGIPTRNKDPRELLSISTTVGLIMKKLKWIKGSNSDRDKYFRTEQIKNEELQWEE